MAEKGRCAIGFIDDLTGGNKKAGEKNSANLRFIKQLFLGPPGAGRYMDLPGIMNMGNELYGKAFDEINKAGGASRRAIDTQTKQHVASSHQQLASSGLYGSTVGPSMDRGIRSDAMRAHGQLEEQLARMRAGLFTGQAGFQAGNIQSLASILSGTQHQAGTNWPLELAKIFAAG